MEEDVVEEDDLHAIISDIIRINKRIDKIWSNSRGWAPDKAADLLERSRLDWIVSLSMCLTDYVSEFTEETRDGRQILGYATLGALVEGTMKTFLSLYYTDYEKDSSAPRNKGGIKNPDMLKFEELRQFFDKRIFIGNELEWKDWIKKIQERRNAIHAFKDKSLGTQKKLHADIVMYHKFLKYIEMHFPPEPEREGNW
ncbi:MAG TPA: hypothetical protein ENJ00_07550 [Phycisphaerales bacterium]|nr:hypothetical protein [Phycisphaerales bacterium]